MESMSVQIDLVVMVMAARQQESLKRSFYAAA
jgi:hypothetical protein